MSAIRQIRQTRYALALSAKGADLTTGTDVAYFVVREAGTLSLPNAHVLTASSGSPVIVDINKNGAGSILSAKLQIDSSENDSSTASSTAALSDASVSVGDVLRFDIDQIGAVTPGKDLLVDILVTHQ